MKKFFLTAIAAFFVAVFIVVGCMIFINLPYISTVDKVGYLEKEPSTEQIQIAIPEEYGVPQSGFVQLVPKRNFRSHAEEVIIIQTDKGLYLQRKGSQGKFFVTDRPMAGFNGYGNGELVPATVVFSGNGCQRVYMDNNDCPEFYRPDIISWEEPCLYKASENGVMQNYTVTMMGQNVKLDKTYEYVVRCKKVRTWHPEVISQEWKHAKEMFSDMFII